MTTETDKTERERFEAWARDWTDVPLTRTHDGHYIMRRVCVWAGDQIAFETPLHNVQGVGYLPVREAAHDL